MNKEEIQKISKELFVKINKFQKELSDVRKECGHEEYKLELFYLKKDLNLTELKRICRYCNQDLGYPTQEETKIWKLDK